MSDAIWRRGVDTQPSPDVIFVGVIEWASALGQDPEVCVAGTVEDIERQYVRLLSGIVEATADAHGIGPLPSPDAPVAEILAWMDVWRENSTDAWLTVVRCELAGVR